MDDLVPLVIGIGFGIVVLLVMIGAKRVQRTVAPPLCMHANTRIRICMMYNVQFAVESVQRSPNCSCMICDLGSPNELDMILHQRFKVTYLENNEVKHISIKVNFSMLFSSSHLLYMIMYTKRFIWSHYK